VLAAFRSKENEVEALRAEAIARAAKLLTLVPFTLAVTTGDWEFLRALHVKAA
jgi:hypothetical protein